MSLALSKTLDPADLDLLGAELDVVDKYFATAAPQHPARRWEYAMALRAVKVYEETAPMMPVLALPPQVYDIGGAGSPFRFMLPHVWVVDPAAEHQDASRCDLGEFMLRAPRLAHGVFCLSVIEHVDDLMHFLYHLTCLVAPGGLLFLTFDCCQGLGQTTWGKDTYHFHWMRQRIFNEWARGMLHGQLLHSRFSLLGGWDPAYHGDQVYDYSFASLALVKDR